MFRMYTPKFPCCNSTGGFFVTLPISLNTTKPVLFLIISRFISLDCILYFKRIFCRLVKEYRLGLSFFQSKSSSFDSCYVLHCNPLQVFYYFSEPFIDYIQLFVDITGISQFKIFVCLLFYTNSFFGIVGLFIEQGNSL